MQFTSHDDNDLPAHLISLRTDSRAPAVHRALTRFFWNGGDFGSAVSLEDALPGLKDGSVSKFLYDKHSGLVFYPIASGLHQQFAAHLAALAATDFEVSREFWQLNDFYDWNAAARLAEDFLEKGLGLYQAGVGRKDAIWVSRAFAWTDLERQAFGHLEHQQF